MPPLALFTILAPVAVLIALFAAKGFALVGVLAGLLGWLLIWRQGWLGYVLGMNSTLLPLGLLGAGLLSALWSIDPGNTLDTMQGFSLMLIASAGLLGLAQLTAAHNGDAVRPVNWRRRYALALLLSFLLLAIMLLSEIVARGGLQAWLIGLTKGGDYEWAPNRSIRSGVFVTLLIWPALLAAYWLTWRPWLPLLLFVLGASASYASPQVTAKLALASGCIVFLLVWLGGRAATWLLGMLAILAVFILPFALQLWLHPDQIIAAYPELHYSAKHRLHIWEFVVQRYAERPWLGWGIDAARIMPGGDMRLPGGTVSMPASGDLLPSHPHNGILQYWLELGMLGGLLLALAQWAIWHALSLPGLSRLGRAAAAAAYATMVGYFLVSFNSWHSWWAGMLACSAALLIVAVRAFGREGRD